MPPRRAAAKKPSPRSKKSALTPSAATPAEVLPTVQEEDEKILEAQRSPAPAAQESNVKGGEKMSLESEGSLLEADLRPSPIADGEEEGEKEEKVAAAEVLASAAVEEGAPARSEDMVEADAMEEKVKDPEASVESEVEPFASPEAKGEENPEAVSEVKDNNGNSNDICIGEGAEQSILENGTVAVEGTEACGSEVGDAVGDGVRSGNDNDSDDSEDEDEIDPSLCMKAPTAQRKRNNEFEIFVGGLSKEAVEHDLLIVFGEFGDVQSARIVRHPVTQQSKGFAFVRYATVEQAKKALADLKDGTEIRGKRIGISASMDNDTLYLGNICKTWTKDQVLETLKGFGIEQIEEILLPDDPNNPGNNKGFAFLELGSHSDAMAAFQRLRKPDAIFGSNRSVKVAFEYSMHPSEEAMSQVKSVYVEGLPLTWDEEKVKEMCKHYGEIENVLLSRNFTKRKRNDFGFVAFKSHESAVACVEGINSAELGEADMKVRASLAKPQRKGHLGKQGVRGGFKVEKNGEVAKEADQSKAKSKAKAEGMLGKGKSVSKTKGSKGKNISKSKGKAIGGKGNAQYHQRSFGSQSDRKRGRRDMVINNSARTSKKARSDFNFHSRPSGGFGSQISSHFRSNDVMHPIRYTSGYAEPATGYRLYGYAGTSGSMYQRSDLEPHAGFSSTARQGQNPYRYGQRSGDAYENHRRISAGAYDNQERIISSGYDYQRRLYSGGYGNQERPSVGGYNNSQGIRAGYPGAGTEPHASYRGSSAFSGYEAGYPYPNSGPYAPQGPYS